MISVCVATYNGGKYLKEQLDSILIQLMPEDEVIVSDDGSSDNTLEIIGNYNDSRIRLINNSGKGVISNFENALGHAQGEIIFLSDQDDIWAANKVKVIQEALNKFDLVITNAQIIDSVGNILQEYFFMKKPSIRFTNNIVKNNFFGATMAFKKKVLKKALPFPTSIPMHDQWIGLIGSYYFTVGYINQPLISYRRHGNNASFCGEKSQNSLFRKISFRMNILFALFKKIKLNK